MTLYRKRKGKREEPPGEPEETPAPKLDPLMYPPSPAITEDGVIIGESTGAAKAALISVNLDTNEVAISIFSTEDGVTDPIQRAYALWQSSRGDRNMRNFLHTIVANQQALTTTQVEGDFKSLGQN